MKKVKPGSRKDEYKAFRLLNPEKQQLTPEKLRELSGLELPDEKADQIIDSIRMLCSVLYQFSNDQKKRYIDNPTQHSINHNTQNLAA